MVYSLYARICEDTVVPFLYILFESVRNTADAQLRVQKKINKGRHIFSVEFEKCVFNCACQRQSPDTLGNPFCAYHAAFNTPYLFTVFLEVDIKHLPPEVADNPVFKRNVLRLPYQILYSFCSIIKQYLYCCGYANAEYCI